MAGLLFLMVVGLWVWAAVVLARWMSRRFLSQRPWRRYASIGLFMLILPLPVVDEIIGGFQFRALCEEGAKLKIDEKRILGKDVKLVVTPKDSPELIPHTAIPIFHYHYSYRDVYTDEEYAQYETYTAKGGVFIRALGISNNNSPLIIDDPAYCGQAVLLHKQYQFNQVN